MTNTGDVTLSDIVVTDHIPGELVVTSISNSGTRDGNTVQWVNIELDPGEQITLTINVEVKADAPNSTICNLATAFSDDRGLSDSDEDCVRIEREPVVAAVTVTDGKGRPAPAVKASAPTGPGFMALASVLSTITGGAGLLVTRRFV